MPRKVMICADTPKFDPAELRNWTAEGYEVEYIPSPDISDLQAAAEVCETDEKYCIIAFGTAATLALEFATKRVGHLAAVIAYYPTSLPTHDIPKDITILLHLSESQPFGPPPGFKLRTYAGTKPGFAETGSVHHDTVNASVAYSRTLGVLRTLLGPDVDLEEIWGEHLLYEFVEKDVDKTMATMVGEPYVNHIPTVTGGIGYTELHRFYKDFFIPGNPPSLKLKLVSRTVGTDRIIDEMVASFRHTMEIPWILPGIQATDREVEVALVSIVCVRGGKLYHEHIYWDQATVLVQLGLLDPKTLPVVGKESAMKVVDKNSVPSNTMIPGWK